MRQGLKWWELDLTYQLIKVLAWLGIARDLRELPPSEASRLIWYVPLNDEGLVNPSRVMRRMTYRHPLYTAGEIRSQVGSNRIRGCNRTHFCGAPWFYGFHARTLNAWRKRFHAAAPALPSLGFDEQFVRMWDYYLAYCEGAFLERHISDFQIVFTKNHNPAPLMDEPWAELDSQPSGVPAETISI